MRHEDYVSFEQAKALKELGFDWEVSHFYGLNEANEPKLCRLPDTLGGQDNHNKYHGNFSAPTLSQAQKWLREKEIEVGVFANFDGELPNGKWVWLMRKFNTHLYDTVFTEDINYDTYEQALSAGIDKALELLKEESNGK